LLCNDCNQALGRLKDSPELATSWLPISTSTGKRGRSARLKMVIT